MNHRRKSLFRTVLGSLVFPGALAVLVGVVAVYSVVKAEYDELFDIGLNSKAHLLLQIFEASFDPASPAQTLDAAKLLSFEQATITPDERPVFWFLDGSGTVVAQSPLAAAHAMADTIAGDTMTKTDTETDGLRTLNGHRVAVLHSASGSGLTAIVAQPLRERNEALREVVIGVIASFVLLGLLVSGAAYWAVRRSVGIVADLSDTIAAKNAHDLSPIDRRNAFAEIEPAIDTLDTLMAQLDSALVAERAFATNAAHELRTPVAICLAHVQRLKTRLDDPAACDSAAEIESGLKRLTRLIERLLQMSRAQSGLGTGVQAHDITPVIALLMQELRDRAQPSAGLVLDYPTGAWPSRVDPDALGIILTNLFDNALKYASGDMAVGVDASQPGRVVISNDCDPLTPGALADITGRFIRKTALSDGFGLGLSIVQTLCTQSGCRIALHSPQPGSARGFSVTLTFPPQQVA
jgi:two-component system OmpR family sensor kinase